MQPSSTSLSLLCGHHPSLLPFVSYTTAVRLESELRAFLAGFHLCGCWTVLLVMPKPRFLPRFQVQSFSRWLKQLQVERLHNKPKSLAGSWDPKVLKRLENICSCDRLKTNHLKPRELCLLQWCARRVMGGETSPNPKHQVLFFTDPNSPLRIWFIQWKFSLVNLYLNLETLEKESRCFDLCQLSQ